MKKSLAKHLPFDNFSIVERHKPKTNNKHTNKTMKKIEVILLAIQQYLQKDAEQQVRWVRSHPERRKLDKQDYELDEWGIYIADCYASSGYRQPKS